MLLEGAGVWVAVGMVSVAAGVCFAIVVVAPVAVGFPGLVMVVPSNNVTNATVVLFWAGVVVITSVVVVVVAAGLVVVASREVVV